MTPEETEVRSLVGLDPWGLRRIEKLLIGLTGVDSLKIVPDGRGGIEEIHVLSASDLGAKQIVRNIESALLAEYGLQIDHRKISVARMKGAEAVPPRPVAEPVVEPPARRLLLEGLYIERSAGQKVACKVELRDRGRVVVGEAEGPDFEHARMEVAAVAVLDAMQQAAEEGVTLSLQGVTRVDALGQSYAIAVVSGSLRRESASLAGIGKVRDSVEEAAVLACLQAVNRWITER